MTNSLNLGMSHEYNRIELNYVSVVIRDDLRYQDDEIDTDVLK